MTKVAFEHQIMYLLCFDNMERGVVFRLLGDVYGWGEKTHVPRCKTCFYRFAYTPSRALIRTFEANLQKYPLDYKHVYTIYDV